MMMQSYINVHSVKNIKPIQYSMLVYVKNFLKIKNIEIFQSAFLGHYKLIKSCNFTLKCCIFFFLIAPIFMSQQDNLVMTSILDFCAC